MEKVLIGKILKPRGLRGELKVQILTNKPDVFLDIDCFNVNDKCYTINDASIQGNFGYFTLVGIKSYEDADELRGKQIWINKDSFPLEDDEVLESDIIGFEMFDEDGKKIGSLDRVENYGSGDILICGEYSIPNEDVFVLETNMKTRKIIVSKIALTAEEIR